MTTIKEVHQLMQKIEDGDVVSRAFARQKASEILATKTIELSIRQILADHLNQQNLLLALKTAVSDDSY
ncbi:MAG: hypothetical protein QNJ37_23755 [Crocosphaera sp.]|nr:hypothetical protein [Crocosphaera sp.]